MGVEFFEMSCWFSSGETAGKGGRGWVDILEVNIYLGLTPRVGTIGT